MLHGELKFKNQISGKSIYLRRALFLDLFPETWACFLPLLTLFATRTAGV
jgi:hypothetical protein